MGWKEWNLHSDWLTKVTPAFWLVNIMSICADSHPQTLLPRWGLGALCFPEVPSFDSGDSSVVYLFHDWLLYAILISCWRGMTFFITALLSLSWSLSLPGGSWVETLLKSCNECVLLLSFLNWMCEVSSIWSMQETGGQQRYLHPLCTLSML